MIFFIRFIIAACFFALLGKANIWLSPLSNTILVVAYRSLLVLSPIVSRILKKYSISISLLIASIGILLFCFHSEVLFVSGAMLLGAGLSVAGYLIRFEASQTSTGAAYNKMAANAGGVIAGLVLMITFRSKTIFFELSAFILFALFLLAFSTAYRQKRMTLNLPKVFDIRQATGWGFFGVAAGIILFSVFSVLPQFLLNNWGKLPSWYGIMIFVNGLVIILFQLPIIRFIEKFKINHAATICLLSMLVGIFLIACPAFFHVEILFGSLLWIFLLSLIECAMCFLDIQGSKSGYLLIKETAVGIGGGLSVLISRTLPPKFSNMTIGFIAAISIFIAYLFTYKNFKLG